MNKYTLKKHIIFSLARATLLDDFKDSKIMLITSGGTIVGTVCNLKDAKDTSDCPSSEYFASLTNQLAKGYREDMGLNPGEPTEGNDGFIILKDVEVTNGSSKTKSNTLVVFLDQIVGISFGKSE